MKKLTIALALLLAGCANFTLDVTATYQTDTVLEAKKQAKEAKETDYTWRAAK